MFSLLPIFAVETATCEWTTFLSIVVIQKQGQEHNKLLEGSNLVALWLQSDVAEPALVKVGSGGNSNGALPWQRKTFGRNMF